MSASFVILSCAIALANCQLNYRQPSHSAAILKDTRYLSGDGTFGAAYSQEDGVEFKEESDEYGNRRGSYSYVDPTGQRRTVTYTAGVNGFQASGDHIPSQQPPTPPQPEYVPLARYNPPDYQPPLRPPRYQLIRQSYEPRYETQESVQVPPPPRRNRPPATTPPEPVSITITQLQYQSPYLEYPSPRVRYESTTDRAQYRPTPTPPSPARFYYNELTAPTSKRFYPPGKLDFNRTPDGFSYTFSKS
ncbi:PREDICTED: early nodulin-75 [Ceratosolen solmsi marchali]|uniref:Early nodulin-75 n=1 Tax=Ceratosolen solmsi marchali TaxID=326594 RepID=A0AAJ6YKX8_9HYME|nr:PREDICTED: early nodulin-75 [Ceratosolen solmsi marchali]